MMCWRKLIIYAACLFFYSTSISFSIGNKIIFKIDQEIITSLDIENEYKYLVALNRNMESLNADQIFEISKKSILREKIKKIAILKNFKIAEIPDDYLDLLIKNIYQKINIKTKDEFKEYLKLNKIDYEEIRKKIEIEALWNQLIMLKFNSKIKIDREEIKNNIKNRKKKITKSYLLSEIVFEIQNSNDLPNKYLEIKKIINENGFDNAALSHSIASTASTGGEIGWIDESSLNNKLQKILSKKKENDITEPISVPGGFLILKINQIKKNEKKINMNDEIQKMINIKTNNQLSQFSIIYFNKVKKDITIDEI